MEDQASLVHMGSKGWTAWSNSTNELQCSSAGSIVPVGTHEYLLTAPPMGSWASELDHKGIDHVLVWWIAFSRKASQQRPCSARPCILPLMWLLRWHVSPTLHTFSWTIFPDVVVSCQSNAPGSGMVKEHEFRAFFKCIKGKWSFSHF